MISEMVLTGMGGGLLRLAPEFFRLIDNKLDRDHEYRLACQHTEHVKALGTEKMAEGAPAFSAAGIAGLQEMYIQKSTDRAAKKYPIIDALAAMVRPTVTWWLVILYSLARMTELVAGRSVYGTEDLALMSGVLSFWFVGRVWDKIRTS